MRQNTKWFARVGLLALMLLVIAAPFAQAQTTPSLTIVPDTTPAQHTDKVPNASPPTPPPLTALVPPAATSGPQVASLIGNTLLARGSRGSPFVIYLQPDRTARLLDQDEVLQARWSVHDETLCLQISRDVGESCYDVSFEDQTVVLTDERGKPRPFDLLPGNAQRL